MEEASQESEDDGPDDDISELNEDTETDNDHERNLADEKIVETSSDDDGESDTGEEQETRIFQDTKRQETTKSKREQTDLHRECRMHTKRTRKTETEVSRPQSTDAPLLLNLGDILRGKKFDRKLRLFVDDSNAADTPVRPVDVTPTPFEDDAVWISGKSIKGVTTLDIESASILHDLKICRRTWRVVVKFGWSVDACPYRIEVLPLVKGLIEKVVLQEPDGVTDPRIVQGSGCVTNSPMEIHCAGSNLQWIHRLKETVVDHNRMNTNDVLAALKYYGVEAARALFLKELNAVFSSYGIHVQTAHLSLVADFVTRDGTITPFNRLGIQASNSPFLQMAFETSFKFLTEACERAAVDSLHSPSASLVVGTPAAIGSQQSELLAVLPDFTDS